MKIDTKLLTNQYDANLGKYNKLASTVEYSLAKTIAKYGIKTHSISYRIKDLSSFLDKIRRNNIENPFEQIHDLVGFRVVCLFLPDLEEIGKIIHEEFDVFEKDDKINDTEINIFGYMSLHLKARLRHTSELSDNDDVNNVPFEIQVRTIAQDAWASISHYLDYKKESIIPDQLKRDFHALSGLFYVADTHFAILRKDQSNLFFENNSK